MKTGINLIPMWIFVIAMSACQLFAQKLRNYKDLRLLAELKEKYGPEIYTKLKKEPSTLRYWLLQKVYAPFGKSKEPVLP